MNKLCYVLLATMLLPYRMRPMSAMVGLLYRAVRGRIYWAH
jgi:hypothetical protein